MVSWPPCSSSCGGKRAANFPVQRALRPQSAGLVEKMSHLCRDTPEPGTGTENHRVVVRQVIDLGKRGGLIQLVVQFLGNVFGHQLRHALDVHVGTR